MRCVGTGRTWAGYNVMMVMFWVEMDAVQSATSNLDGGVLVGGHHSLTNVLKYVVTK